MSDKKGFDPETDIIFTADIEVQKYFAEKGFDHPDKTSATKTSTATGSIENKLVFFDYKSDFFRNFSKELDANIQFEIVTEIESIPKYLVGTKTVLFFLNFSAYPRLCQQLIPKVRKRFSNAKLVMVAKNLTAEKVQDYQNSDYAADDYLSYPFTKEDFLRVVTKYE